MVKVTSDVLDDAALRKMGIIVVNSPGGEYAYYNADSDKRMGSEYQKEIIEDMGTAAKIWKNKPACWQDHFRRSKKEQSYGFSMDPQYGTTLSGYNLAIQLLMDSLGKKDGEYYNPDCFCIHPTDFLGQTLPMRSRFRLIQPKPANYVYDETHLLEYYEGERKRIYNPFISAAIIEYGRGCEAYLETDMCTPLIEDTGWWSVDIGNVRYPAQYFPIKLKPVDGAYPYDIPITDKYKWIYTALGTLAKGGYSGYMRKINITDEDIGTDEVGSGLTPIKGIFCEFVDPTNEGSLCGVSNVALQLIYSAAGLSIASYATNQPPWWDVCYGETPLFRIGSGFGEPTGSGYSISYKEYKNYELGSHGLHNPPPKLPQHLQDYHPLEGVVIEAPLPNVVCGDACSEYDPPPGCGAGSGENICPDNYAWNSITYYYHLGKPIPTDWKLHSPQLMVTLKNICYDSRGFQNWYPWGSAEISVGMDGEYGGMFTPALKDIVFGYPRMKYCVEYNGSVDEFDSVRITLRTTTLWGCCERTQLGNPMDSPKCECQSYPSLWFLDRTGTYGSDDDDGEV